MCHNKHKSPKISSRSSYTLKNIKSRTPNGDDTEAQFIRTKGCSHCPGTSHCTEITEMEILKPHLKATTSQSFNVRSGVELSISTGGVTSTKFIFELSVNTKLG